MPVLLDIAIDLVEFGNTLRQALGELQSGLGPIARYWALFALLCCRVVGGGVDDGEIIPEVVLGKSVITFEKCGDFGGRDGAKEVFVDRGKVLIGWTVWYDGGTGSANRFRHRSGIWRCAHEGRKQ